MAVISVNVSVLKEGYKENGIEVKDNILTITKGIEVTFTDGDVAYNVINYGTIKNGNFTKAVLNYEGIIEYGTFSSSVNNYENATIKGGVFKYMIDNAQSTISGGTFSGEVENTRSIISGGTFKDIVKSINSIIENGVFSGSVSIGSNSTISGGTFEKQVTNLNGSTIDGGTFEKQVTNANGSTIDGGTFKGKVENRANSTIKSGDFSGEVKNDASTIDGGNFNDKVENINGSTIDGGNFKGKVENNSTIESGTFSGEVSNNNSATIKDGTFSNKVENNNSTIENLTAKNGFSLSQNSGTTNNITIDDNDVKLDKTSFDNAQKVEVEKGGKLFLPNDFDINNIKDKIDGDGVIIIDSKEYNTDGEWINKPAPTPSYTPTYKPKPKPDDKKEEDNQDDQKEPQKEPEQKDEPKEPQKEPEPQEPQKEPEQKEEPKEPQKEPEPKEEQKEHSSSHYDELTNPNIIELKNGSQVISIHATDNHKIITGSGADATVAFVLADGTGASINAINADMAGLNATNGADLLDLTGSRIGVANAGFGFDVLVLGSDSKIDFAFGFNTALIKGAQSLHTGLGTIKSGEVAFLGDFGSWHSYMLFGAQPGSFIVTNDGANSHIFSVNESTTELIATLNGSYMANNDGALISFDNAIFI